MISCDEFLKMNAVKTEHNAHGDDSFTMEQKFECVRPKGLDPVTKGILDTDCMSKPKQLMNVVKNCLFSCVHHILSSIITDNKSSFRLEK